jgi:dTDP-glucose pyrophosphorylase/CBS domain-containing protein
MDTLIISHTLAIKEALGLLDSSPVKTLFVINENRQLLGSLTDGDIRRWILNTGDLRGTVEEACFRDPFVLEPSFNRTEALQIMTEKHLEAAPLMAGQRIIDRIILKEELSGIATPVSTNALANLPVVIMAGGRGTRLDPFTRILPKPLIPIGNQPVIELIMQQFARFGADRFYITLNHKAALVKAFFEEQQYPYRITFVEEDQPLGTAGALKLLQGTLSGDLFVSNCDVIVRGDYNQMVKFHRDGGFALTIVAAIHNQLIPYGVCEADERGQLQRLTEKPEFSMLINTGMYLLKSETIDFIPDQSMYHITHLINDLQKAGQTIGVFPLPQEAWHDVGQWEEYRTAIQTIGGSH